MSEENQVEDLFQVTILNETEVLLSPTDFMAVNTNDARVQAVGEYARKNPEASLKNLRVKVRPF